MSELQKHDFNYGQLDTSTADYLKQKETNMREIVGKAYTDLGRELKEAQDELAKHGYGCYYEWCESNGIHRKQAERLTNRYELITTNCRKQDLIEDLPVSLTYEIAKPSAASELKQKVLDGEVKSLKEYRELKEQKEKAEKARETAERSEKIIRHQLEELESQEPEVIEKEVVKEVMPESEKRRLQELENFKRTHGQRIKEIEIEKSEIEASLMESYARVRELEKLEKSVKHERENPLYDIYRSTAGTVGHIKAFMDNERFAYDVLANSDQKIIRKLENEIKNNAQYINKLLSLINYNDGTVIVEVKESPEAVIVEDAAAENEEHTQMSFDDIGA